jgi:tripartite-type tricarboxylate transporter receptor subunit TctC
LVSQNGFREGTMKLPRRKFLRLTAGAAALPTAPWIARAQVYPTRPVRILVGYSPGGVADVVSRVIGQWLSERLGQPFVIENRPGAAGNVATAVVVKAPLDGYTLLTVGSNNAINASLYENLPFDFIGDIAPVAGLHRNPLVMEVNPSVPAKTVAEFIAYAKANPGKINMGSGGNGSTPHIAGELFKMMTGINMVHVPYRGTGAMFADFLGGQVQVAFDNIPSSIGYIRAAQLRALAVTSATRLEALPDVPTVGEFVPGYEAIGWTGIGAPRNTPVEIINKLNSEINAGLTDPKLSARLADLGGVPMPMTPEEFRKFIAAEIAKWAKTVKFAGIKPE